MMYATIYYIQRYYIVITIDIIDKHNLQPGVRHWNYIVLFTTEKLYNSKI